MTEFRRPTSPEAPSLQFRPVHPGLGFHPFSDGLPYAPAAPARSPSVSPGAGATVAGPIEHAKRVPQPISAPLLPPVLPTVLPSLQHKSVPLRQTPVTAPVETAPEIRVELNFGWGYPVARVFAFSFDLVFHLALAATGITIALAFADLEPWFLLENGVAGMTLLFLVAFSWALMTAQEVAFGTTLGKRIVGLRLRGSATAIFLRAFFFLPSFGFGGAGILWALFDRNKRCWHDVTVDLQPTRATQL